MLARLRRQRLFISVKGTRTGKVTPPEGAH
jgi:hypothetical protein